MFKKERIGVFTRIKDVQYIFQARFIRDINLTGWLTFNSLLYIIALPIIS